MDWFAAKNIRDNDTLAKLMTISCTRIKVDLHYITTNCQYSSLDKSFSGDHGAHFKNECSRESR